VYKNSILINVLTPAFKTHLIEKKGIPEEKIIQIYNAADFSLSDIVVNNFNRIRLILNGTYSTITCLLIFLSL
jgi:hypothetical protein